MSNASKTSKSLKSGASKSSKTAGNQPADYTMTHSNMDNTANTEQIIEICGTM